MTSTINTELKRSFFDGMSHAACTVNVVTTDGAAGLAGVTVSAMASVSADTPLPSLLVCVHHQSPTAAAILENRVFCVNVLRDDQSFISDTFAGRLKTDDGDKFSCANWTTGPTGAPRVVDPLVAFDCRLMNSEQVGTHWVFFGAVEDIFIARHGSPLIYANRAYGTPANIREHSNETADSQGEQLNLGCFRTFGPYIVPALIARLTDDYPATALKLYEGDQKQTVERLLTGDAEIALLYDLELDDELALEPMGALDPYVLLAQGHPLSSRARLSITDLADEPYVLLDAPTSREYFLSIFKAAGVEPNIRFRSSAFEMVRGLVGHGLGYSLLATKPASNMTYDGRALITLPLDCNAPGSRVVLATRKDARLSPIAESFRSHCRDYFRNAVA